MRQIFIVSLLSLIALVQGCVSVPANKPADNAASLISHQEHLKRIAAIQTFSLKGRIGVQTEGKGFSGGLEWQHALAQDNIALYSPLGGQVANIKKTPAEVTLEDAQGNSVTAADAESLTQKTLGWKLPLTGLADWSLGRPSNNSPIDSIVWDDAGQITRLVQDGWDIEYADYVAFEGNQLPNKVYLRSPKVNIKLIVENRFSVTP
jgi:outer membrane lipoprotein LolB